jgi:hypothetical protein
MTVRWLTLENVCYIPLLCIEDIYVKDMSKDKHLTNSFLFNTASETYTIKCNSDLDWDLWIKSLIHSTNLAKESFIIKDIRKKIENNQTFLFDLSSKNSICDINYIIEDRKQLDRCFSIFDDFGRKFFPDAKDSSQLVEMIRAFTKSFNEIRKLKKEGLESVPLQKLGGVLKTLDSGLLEELFKSGQINTTIDKEEEVTERNRQDMYDKISKIADDLFYNLQRMSVSNNIFLEEHYHMLEKHLISQYQDIIV